MRMTASVTTVEHHALAPTGTYKYILLYNCSSLNLKILKPFHVVLIHERHFFQFFNTPKMMLLPSVESAFHELCKRLWQSPSSQFWWLSPTPAPQRRQSWCHCLWGASCCMPSDSGKQSKQCLVKITCDLSEIFKMTIRKMFCIAVLTSKVNYICWNIVNLGSATVYFLLIVF